MFFISLLLLKLGIEVKYQEMPVGGSAIDLAGVPLPEETLSVAKQSDAILLGAIGGYKWDKLEKKLKPETGLLQLRSGLDVFANLRPATVLPQIMSFMSLQSLSISSCDNLELGNNEEATMTSLEWLDLSYLPKLVDLPEELQYLTTLQSLSIRNCENLECLPEWINCLTSLQTLEIQRCHKLKSLPEAIARMRALQALYIIGCDNLQRRCREPDGEDWPIVCHICHLNVRDLHESIWGEKKGRERRGFKILCLDSK